MQAIMESPQKKQKFAHDLAAKIFQDMKKKIDPKSNVETVKPRQAIEVRCHRPDPKVDSHIAQTGRNVADEPWSKTTNLPEKRFPVTGRPNIQAEDRHSEQRNMTRTIRNLEKRPLNEKPVDFVGQRFETASKKPTDFVGQQWNVERNIGAPITDKSRQRQLPGMQNTRGSFVSGQLNTTTNIGTPSIEPPKIGTPYIGPPNISNPQPTQIPGMQITQQGSFIGGQLNTVPASANYLQFAPPPMQRPPPVNFVGGQWNATQNIGIPPPMPLPGMQQTQPGSFVHGQLKAPTDFATPYIGIPQQIQYQAVERIQTLNFVSRMVNAMTGVDAPNTGNPQPIPPGTEATQPGNFATPSVGSHQNITSRGIKRKDSGYEQRNVKPNAKSVKSTTPNTSSKLGCGQANNDTKTATKTSDAKTVTELVKESTIYKCAKCGYTAKSDVLVTIHKLTAGHSHEVTFTQRNFYRDQWDLLRDFENKMFPEMSYDKTARMEKPYLCGQCGFRGISSDSVRHHINVHKHQYARVFYNDNIFKLKAKTMPSQFVCSRCGQKCKEFAGVQSHAACTSKPGHSKDTPVLTGGFLFNDYYISYGTEMLKAKLAIDNPNSGKSINIPYQNPVKSTNIRDPYEMFKAQLAIDNLNSAKSVNFPHQNPVHSTNIRDQNPVKSTNISQQKPVKSTNIRDRNPVKLKSANIPDQKPVKSANIPDQKPVKSTNIPHSEKVIDLTNENEDKAAPRVTDAPKLAMPYSTVNSSVLSAVEPKQKHFEARTVTIGNIARTKVYKDKSQKAADQSKPGLNKNQTENSISKSELRLNQEKHINDHGKKKLEATFCEFICAFCGFQSHSHAMVNEHKKAAGHEDTVTIDWTEAMADVADIRLDMVTTYSCSVCEFGSEFKNIVTCHVERADARTHMRAKVIEDKVAQTFRVFWKKFQNRQLSVTSASTDGDANLCKTSQMETIPNANVSVDGSNVEAGIREKSEAIKMKANSESVMDAESSTTLTNVDIKPCLDLLPIIDLTKSGKWSVGNVDASPDMVQVIDLTTHGNTSDMYDVVHIEMPTHVKQVIDLTKHKTPYSDVGMDNKLYTAIDLSESSGRCTVSEVAMEVDSESPPKALKDADQRPTDTATSTDQGHADSAASALLSKPCVVSVYDWLIVKGAETMPEEDVQSLLDDYPYPLDRSVAPGALRQTYQKGGWRCTHCSKYLPHRRMDAITHYAETHLPISPMFCKKCGRKWYGDKYSHCKRKACSHSENNWITIKEPPKPNFDGGKDGGLVDFIQTEGLNAMKCFVNETTVNAVIEQIIVTCNSDKGKTNEYVDDQFAEVSNSGEGKPVGNRGNIKYVTQDSGVEMKSNCRRQTDAEMNAEISKAASLITDIVMQMVSKDLDEENDEITQADEKMVMKTGNVDKTQRIVTKASADVIVKTITKNVENLTEKRTVDKRTSLLTVTENLVIIGSTESKQNTEVTMVTQEDDNVVIETENNEERENTDRKRIAEVSLVVDQMISDIENANKIESSDSDINAQVRLVVEKLITETENADKETTYAEMNADVCLIVEKMLTEIENIDKREIPDIKRNSEVENMETETEKVDKIESSGTKGNIEETHKIEKMVTETENVEVINKGANLSEFIREYVIQLLKEKLNQVMNYNESNMKFCKSLVTDLKKMIELGTHEEDYYELYKVIAEKRQPTVDKDFIERNGNALHGFVDIHRPGGDRISLQSVDPLVCTASTSISQCRLCAAIGPSLQWFQAHYKCHKDGEMVYICEDCGHYGKTQGELRQHHATSGHWRVWAIDESIVYTSHDDAAPFVVIPSKVMMEQAGVSHGDDLDLDWGLLEQILADKLMKHPVRDITAKSTVLKPRFWICTTCGHISHYSGWRHFALTHSEHAPYTCSTCRLRSTEEGAVVAHQKSVCHDGRCVIDESKIFPLTFGPQADFLQMTWRKFHQLRCLVCCCGFKTMVTSVMAAHTSTAKGEHKYTRRQLTSDSLHEAIREWSAVKPVSADVVKVKRHRRLQWKCNVCQTVKRIDELKPANLKYWPITHYLISHSPEPPYFCGLCGFKATSRDRIRKHIYKFKHGTEYEILQGEDVRYPRFDIKNPDITLDFVKDDNPKPMRIPTIVKTVCKVPKHEGQVDTTVCAIPKDQGETIHEGPKDTWDKAEAKGKARQRARFKGNVAKLGSIPMIIKSFEQNYGKPSFGYAWQCTSCGMCMANHKLSLIHFQHYHSPQPRFRCGDCWFPAWNLRYIDHHFRMTGHSSNSLITAHTIICPWFIGDQRDFLPIKKGVADLRGRGKQHTPCNPGDGVKEHRAMVWRCKICPDHRQKFCTLFQDHAQSLYSHPLQHHRKVHLAPQGQSRCADCGVTGISNHMQKHSAREGHRLVTNMPVFEYPDPDIVLEYCDDEDEVKKKPKALKRKVKFLKTHVKVSNRGEKSILKKYRSFRRVESADKDATLTGECAKTTEDAVSPIKTVDDVKQQEIKSSERDKSHILDKSPDKEVKSTEKEVRSTDKDVHSTDIEVKSPDNEVQLMEMETKASDREVKSPWKEGRSPDEEVQLMEIDVKSQEGDVKSPDKEVKSSEQAGKSPKKEFISADKEVKSTAKEVKSTENEVKSPDKEVKSTEKEVRSPDNEVKSPEKEFKSPDKEVKSQEKEVKCPDKEVKSPEKEVKSPDKDVKPPEKEVKSPDKEVKLPEKEVKAPDKEVKYTEKEVSSPDKEVKLPEKEVKAPDKEVKLPETEVNSPDKEVKSTEKEVRSPDKEVKSTEKEVKSPEKEVKSPETEVNSQEKEVKSPVSKEVDWPDKEFMSPDKEVKLLDKEVDSFEVAMESHDDDTLHDEQVKTSDKAVKLLEVAMESLDEGTSEVRLLDVEMESLDKDQSEEKEVTIIEKEARSVGREFVPPDKEVKLHNKVNLPEKEVKQSDQEVILPNTEVKSPGKEMKLPEKDVDMLEKGVLSPDKETEGRSPEKAVKSFEEEEDRSEIEVKSPEKEVNLSDKVVKLPEKDVNLLEKDVTNVKTPKVDSLDSDENALEKQIESTEKEPDVKSQEKENVHKSSGLDSKMADLWNLSTKHKYRVTPGKPLYFVKADGLPKGYIWECTNCGTILQLDIAVAHFLRYHAPYSCTACVLQDGSKSNVIQHFETAGHQVSKDGKMANLLFPLFYGPQADFVPIENDGSVTLHIKTCVPGQIIKKYSQMHWCCQLCGMKELLPLHVGVDRTNRAGDLQYQAIRHFVLKHSRDAPYMCTCGKRTIDDTDMKEHCIATDHSMEKVRRGNPTLPNLVGMYPDIVLVQSGDASDTDIQERDRIQPKLTLPSGESTTTTTHVPLKPTTTTIKTEVAQKPKEAVSDEIIVPGISPNFISIQYQGILKNFLWKCSLCGVIYEIAEAREHFRHFHCKTSVFACGYCGFRAKDREDMDTHLYMSHHPIDQVCEVRHILVYGPQPDLIPVARQEEVQLGIMEKHCNAGDITKEYKPMGWKCKVCGVVKRIKKFVERLENLTPTDIWFTLPDTAMYHYQTHVEPIHRCVICHVKVTGDMGMESHRRITHNEHMKFKLLKGTLKLPEFHGADPDMVLVIVEDNAQEIQQDNGSTKNAKQTTESVNPITTIIGTSEHPRTGVSEQLALNVDAAKFVTGKSVSGESRHFMDDSYTPPVEGSIWTCTTCGMNLPLARTILHYVHYHRVAPMVSCSECGFRGEIDQDVRVHITSTPLHKKAKVSWSHDLTYPFFYGPQADFIPHSGSGEPIFLWRQTIACKPGEVIKRYVEMVWVCRLCGETETAWPDGIFPTKVLLAELGTWPRQHYVQKHCDTAPLTCWACDDRFYRKTDFKDHCRETGHNVQGITGPRNYEVLNKDDIELVLRRHMDILMVDDTVEEPWWKDPDAGEGKATTDDAVEPWWKDQDAGEGKATTDDAVEPWWKDQDAGEAKATTDVVEIIDVDVHDDGGDPSSGDSINQRTDGKDGGAENTKVCKDINKGIKDQLVIVGDGSRDSVNNIVSEGKDSINDSNVNEDVKNSSLSEDSVSDIKGSEDSGDHSEGNTANVEGMKKTVIKDGKDCVKESKDNIVNDNDESVECSIDSIVKRSSVETRKDASDTFVQDESNDDLDLTDLLVLDEIGDDVGNDKIHVESPIEVVTTDTCEETKMRDVHASNARKRKGDEMKQVVTRKKSKRVIARKNSKRSPTKPLATASSSDVVKVSEGSPIGTDHILSTPETNDGITASSSIKMSDHVVENQQMARQVLEMEHNETDIDMCEPGGEVEAENIPKDKTLTVASSSVDIGSPLPESNEDNSMITDNTGGMDSGGVEITVTSGMVDSGGDMNETTDAQSSVVDNSPVQKDAVKIVSLASPSKGTFTCTDCGKVCKSKGGLSSHQRVHKK